MLVVKEGQCGLCSHFGEQHPQETQLVQIRTTHRAPEDYVDKCGRNQGINLKVTAASGCSGFELAAA